MNHPDWPAFVAAVVAEPDEDMPRLAFADHLEENGDPDRAAFIRVQIALARLAASGLSRSPEADELRKRERAFLRTGSVYPRLWAATECPELVEFPAPARAGSPLANLRVDGVERLTWRRGFVEAVRCPAAEWLRRGVAVRTRNPVSEVALHACDVPARDDWYAHLNALRGLREIYVGGNFIEPDRAAEFISWLREWLSGARVEWAPV